MNRPTNVIDPNGMAATEIEGGVRFTGQNAIDAFNYLKTRIGSKDDEKKEQKADDSPVLIAGMAGANTFMTGSKGSLPELMSKTANKVNKNTKRNFAFQIFATQYWGTDLKTGKGFDSATQGPFDFIKNNYVKGSKVILYGHSYGAALLNHLADRLGKAEIQVDLMIQTDAAGGSQNEHVRRIVSSNVAVNYNFYQTVPEVIEGFTTGSHGEPNVASNPFTVINNIDLTGKAPHGGTDEYTHNQVSKIIYDIINN